jgi:SPP1 gp7 family putative phage head morphogenesis protein
MSDRRKARRPRVAPPKTLAAIRPNAGTEARYRKRLQALIREMDASVQYWVRATYKANEPRIALDELPAKALEKAMKKLAKRWQKQFDELAPKLADHFTQAADKRSSLQLKSMLREHGFTVEFKMTDTMRDVMNASVAEQVSLIKSIPQKYFTDVHGSVMRSVQAGRDLSTLTKDLQENYGVSFRRAAFIARDQNNKATATMTRARQIEIGITEAVWMHSGGGRVPRPTHLAMNGKRYDVTEGMWDPAVGRMIYPGEEPNCRCVSGAVVPGFS